MKRRTLPLLCVELDFQLALFPAKNPFRDPEIDPLHA
jgi:hypothetical protein